MLEKLLTCVQPINFAWQLEMSFQSIILFFQQERVQITFTGLTYLYSIFFIQGVFLKSVKFASCSICPTPVHRDQYKS